MKIIGIDPGLKGALAVIENGKITSALNLPILHKKEINCLMLKSCLMIEIPDLIYVEQVHALYGASSASTFSFGMGYGTILGVIRTLEFSHCLVPPKVWQKKMHVGVPDKLKAKERSRIVFDRLLPYRQGLRVNDGIIDASLIALYGASQHGESIILNTPGNTIT